MNALVGFRANTEGALLATSPQRQSAMDKMAANLRAKLQAALRGSTAAKANATGQTAAAKAAAKSSTSDKKSNELDKNSFLTLLVTQMQNQDPLNPTDNSEMIAQLAQFSSLEQMTNLNTSFESFGENMEVLTGNMDQLNFISAQGMLGKWVQGLNVNGKIVSGNVDAVTLDGSIVVLSVGSDHLPMTGILQVANEAPAAKGRTP